MYLWSLNEILLVQMDMVTAVVKKYKGGERTELNLLYISNGMETVQTEFNAQCKV